MAYQETESEKKWNEYQSILQGMSKECRGCDNNFSEPGYIYCKECRNK